MDKKNKKEKNRRNKMHQTAIPKSCQQPRTRSHGPRPRTDFSHFLSSAPPPPRPHQGSNYELSSCKNNGFSITTTTADMNRRASFLRLQEQNPKFPLMRLCVSADGGHRCSLNCRQVISANVESEAQCAPPEIYDICRNNGGHVTDEIYRFSSDEVLPYSPNKTASQIAVNGNVLVPGCVVWAKTAKGTWWPAEVMGERASANDQTVGHVLVQFYGSHDHAWVDPEGDLSHFEDYSLSLVRLCSSMSMGLQESNPVFPMDKASPLFHFQGTHHMQRHSAVGPESVLVGEHFSSLCFEERICNPTKMFQDALKLALHRKERLTPSEQGNESPDPLMNSNHEEQSSDKWNTSSSSRVEDDCHDSGRGKRKRKAKVHFDELMCPFKSKKKGRRLRIMRHLGLVAPSGSPFALSSHVRTTF